MIGDGKRLIVSRGEMQQALRGLAEPTPHAKVSVPVLPYEVDPSAINYHAVMTVPTIEVESRLVVVDGVARWKWIVVRTPEFYL